MSLLYLSALRCVDFSQHKVLSGSLTIFGWNGLEFSKLQAEYGLPKITIQDGNRGDIASVVEKMNSETRKQR